MLEPTPQHAEPLVDSFAALNVSKPILQALERIGYEKPTPVQAACIPLIYAGIDLIVQSQTGTGKTAAFAIPVCDMLRESARAESGDPKAVVECLVLAPTRELAKQVCAEFERIAPDVPSTPIYGGTSYGPQLEALKTARVIAATPGRLLDHLRSGNIKLDHLKIFILDEADEMLSMGFQEELDAIIEFLSGGLQSLLFSATVTEDIKSLASHFLQHPEYVTLSSDSVAARSVKHLYYVTTGLSQLRDLVTLIEAHDPDSALIFCNTRDDTALVASHLQRTGYKADIISGDLPQSERERALFTLKEGKIRFLVATDVAARGIDISELPFVFNYQMPNSAENYIHRTGRTGRAGRKGVAITLMTPREIGTYYQLIRVYHIDLEERPLPTREQLNEIREARMRDQLIERLRDDQTTRRHSPYTSLAERIRSADDGDELIARLVAHFESTQRRDETRAAALERARDMARRHTDETRALKAKLEEAEERSTALRERLVELEASGQELDKLRDELARAEQASRDIERELEQARESANTLEARLKQADQRETEAGQRAERAEQRVSRLEGELEQARAQAPVPARQTRPAPEERRETARREPSPVAETTATETAVTEARNGRGSRVEEEAERYSSRGARRTRRTRRTRPEVAEEAEAPVVTEPEAARAASEPEPRAREARRDEEESSRSGRRRRRTRRRGRSGRGEAGEVSTESRRVEESREERAEPTTPVEAGEAAPEEAPFATIAVTVERSDIESPDMLREMVCYMAGLFPEDLGAVSRTNGRYLVDVRADYAHDVVEALDGQAWKGRKMRARPAPTRA